MGNIFAIWIVVTFLVVMYLLRIHYATYSKLIKSFKDRGIVVTNLKLDFWDFGSRGALDKILLINRGSYKIGSLNETEQRLISKSEVAHNKATKFLFASLLVFIVITIVIGIFGNER